MVIALRRKVKGGTLNLFGLCISLVAKSRWRLFRYIGISYHRAASGSSRRHLRDTHTQGKRILYCRNLRAKGTAKAVEWWLVLSPGRHCMLMGMHW